MRVACIANEPLVVYTPSIVNRSPVTCVYPALTGAVAFLRNTFGPRGHIPNDRRTATGRKIYTKDVQWFYVLAATAV